MHNFKVDEWGANGLAEQHAERYNGFKCAGGLNAAQVYQAISTPVKVVYQKMFQLVFGIAVVTAHKQAMVAFGYLPRIGHQLVVDGVKCLYHVGAR